MFPCRSSVATSGRSFPTASRTVGQQGALDVVDTLGRSGAVQREADRIDRPGRAERLQQLIPHHDVGIAGDRGGGLGRRGKGRHDLDAVLATGGDHAPQEVADTIVHVQDFGAVLPFQRLELRDAGQPGAEGIGLVGNFSDGNSHGRLLTRVMG